MGNWIDVVFYLLCTGGPLGDSFPTRALAGVVHVRRRRGHDPDAVARGPIEPILRRSVGRVGQFIPHGSGDVRAGRRWWISRDDSTRYVYLNYRTYGQLDTDGFCFVQLLQGLNPPRCCTLAPCRCPSVYSRLSSRATRCSRPSTRAWRSRRSTRGC
jgi:hypothetical protein